MHGSLNSKAVVKFFETLDNNIHRPNCVFWDNTSWHTSSATKSALTRLELQPIQNLPYASEFNPIELMFWWLKNEFRRLRLDALINEEEPNYDSLVG